MKPHENGAKAEGNLSALKAAKEAGFRVTLFWRPATSRMKPSLTQRIRRAAT
jgi:hypothetical protein